MESTTKPFDPARFALILGAALTVSVLLVPFVQFAYLNPSLHIAIDVADAFIAILVAYLLVGRVREHSRAGDLLAVLALLVFAVTNLISSVDVLPGYSPSSELYTWGPLVSRLVAALLFATAPYLNRRLQSPGRWIAGTVLAGPALVALLWLTIAPFARILPLGVSLTQGPGPAAAPRLEGHPLLLLTQGLSVLIYAVAAVGFTQRARREGDDLLRWFGAAAILGAFARLTYVLFPSLYTEYVYIGDILRLGFYLLLLIGARGEILSFWSSRSEAAVLEERRRLARDLHDGLAQELVFMSSQARRLAADSAERTAEPLQEIANAGDRALADARRAIFVLTSEVNESLTIAVRRTVDEMSARADFKIVTELEESVHVDPADRENLIRILREALVNAAKHSEATRISVRLWTDGGIHLHVQDDGIGFATEEAAVKRGAFGLVSMRERAVAIGGDLRIDARPEHGTVIELHLP